MGESQSPTFTSNGVNFNFAVLKKRKNFAMILARQHSGNLYFRECFMGKMSSFKV